MHHSSLYPGLPEQPPPPPPPAAKKDAEQPKDFVSRKFGPFRPAIPVTIRMLQDTQVCRMAGSTRLTFPSIAGHRICFSQVTCLGRVLSIRENTAPEDEIEEYDEDDGGGGSETEESVDHPPRHGKHHPRGHGSNRRGAHAHSRRRRRRVAPFTEVTVCDGSGMIQIRVFHPTQQLPDDLQRWCLSGSIFESKMASSSSSSSWSFSATCGDYVVCVGTPRCVDTGESHRVCQWLEVGSSSTYPDTFEDCRGGGVAMPTVARLQTGFSSSKCRVVRDSNEIQFHLLAVIETSLRWKKRLFEQQQSSSHCAVVFDGEEDNVAPSSGAYMDECVHHGEGWSAHAEEAVVAAPLSILSDVSTPQRGAAFAFHGSSSSNGKNKPDSIAHTEFSQDDDECTPHEQSCMRRRVQTPSGGTEEHMKQASLLQPLPLPQHRQHHLPTPPLPPPHAQIVSGSFVTAGAAAKRHHNYNNDVEMDDGPPTSTRCMRVPHHDSAFSQQHDGGATSSVFLTSSSSDLHFGKGDDHHHHHHNNRNKIGWGGRDRRQSHEPHHVKESQRDATNAVRSFMATHRLPAFNSNHVQSTSKPLAWMRDGDDDNVFTPDTIPFYQRTTNDLSTMPSPPTRTWMAHAEPPSPPPQAAAEGRAYSRDEHRWATSLDAEQRRPPLASCWRPVLTSFLPSSFSRIVQSHDDGCRGEQPPPHHHNYQRRLRL